MLKQPDSFRTSAGGFGWRVRVRRPPSIALVAVTIVSHPLPCPPIAPLPYSA